MSRWIDSKTHKSKHSQAGLYWFNRQKISGLETPFYGAYVYRHLLPHFSPNQVQPPLDNYVFFDGDFLPQEPVEIPSEGPEEATILEEIKRDQCLCYIVAVFCHEHTSHLKEVDRRLRAEGTVGYMGMTSCSRMDTETFYTLMSTLHLVLALRIQEGQPKKINFHFFPEEDLRTLGFLSSGLLPVSKTLS